MRTAALRLVNPPLHKNNKPKSIHNCREVNNNTQRSECSHQPMAGTASERKRALYTHTDTRVDIKRKKRQKERAFSFFSGDQSRYLWTQAEWYLVSVELHDGVKSSAHNYSFIYYPSFLFCLYFQNVRDLWVFVLGSNTCACLLHLIFMSTWNPNKHTHI